MDLSLDYYYNRDYTVLQKNAFNMLGKINSKIRNKYALLSMPTRVLALPTTAVKRS